MEFDNEEELIKDIRKSLDDIDPEIEAIVTGIDIIIDAFERTTDKLPASRKKNFGFGIISYLANELGYKVAMGDD